MRAVITGITGFLGSHLAEHLVASGDDVLGVARRGAWPSALANESELVKLPLVLWNLSDDLTGGAIPAETVDAISQFQPEVIFHFAALSNPRDCGQITPNALAMQINVEGARAVAQLAATLPGSPRLVFASSEHVYARPACGAYVHEESLLEPSRGYGMTKLAAERVFRSMATDQQLDVVIARSFQHAGPRQEPRLMLAEWACQFAMAKPGPVRVHSLNTMIDITDGRDAVRAYRDLAIQGQAGRVYNIGSGTRQRTGDVLDLLQAAAGGRREVTEIEPGFRRNLIADIGRISNETSWRPRVPIETTVRETLAWWQSRIAAVRSRQEPADRTSADASVS